MNSPTHLDSNIPMLTEVIANDEMISFTASPSVLSQTALTTNAIPLEDTKPLVYDRQTWEELEKTLRENVLRQLLTRVDFVLEHRIRDGLADVLQIAVENLTKEIRSGLSVSLEEILQRTINQEISKIQSSQNKN